MIELVCFVGVTIAAIAIVLWERRLSAAWAIPCAMIITARAWIELAVGPVMHRTSKGDPIFGLASAAEMPGAIALQAVGYASIVIGLVVVLSRRRAQLRSVHDVSWSRTATIQAATIIGLVGVALNALVLAYLSAAGETLESIADRATFTNETVLQNPIYHAARSYSSFALVGAVVLVLVARRSWDARLGLAFGGIHLVLNALQGSRTEVFVSGALLAFAASRSPVKAPRSPFPIRLRTAAAIGVLVLAGAYIYSARFDASLSTVANAAIEDLARPKRLDDAAYVRREVPAQLRHAGAGPLIAGLAHAVPVVEVPTIRSTWTIILDHELGGVNPHGGIGGSNVSTAAELYLAFGWAGVGIGGMLLGAVIGGLVRLGLGLPRELRLAATGLVAIAAFGLVSTRPTYLLSAYLTGVLLPLAFITAMATREAQRRMLKLLAVYAMVASLVMSAMVARMAFAPSLLSAMRGAIGLVMVLAYVGLFWSVGSWRSARRSATRPVPAPIR